MKEIGLSHRISMIETWIEMVFKIGIFLQNFFQTQNILYFPLYNSLLFLDLCQITAIFNQYIG